MINKKVIEAGDVVQINPESDQVFGGHFLVVTEVKSWGVQGYCMVFQQPQDDGTIKPGGLAYYRCKYENFEYVGSGHWIYGINE